ncbi:MAG: cobalamin-binding protein [Gammaproteobacteria bacterium]|nr:cobalamin-binding protein [Gammaproteobacteria bacterium]
MNRLIVLLGIYILSFSLAAEQEPKQLAQQKIVALTPHLVEMLYAIGAGDRIVGTVEYADYPEAAKNILRIGSYTGVQIEKIIELDPQLIVASRSTNKEDDLKKLESLGYSIFYTEPKQISDISKDVIRLGKVTGLNANANTVANELQQRYLSIIKRYQNTREVKVFYQLWHDPMRTLGPNSWISSMINDCRGKNIFHDASSDYPVVSLESVVMRDPEVIVIPHHSGTALAKKEIWQNWQEIDAVANQRMVVIHGDILHRFTPRALDGLEQLCQAIDSAR